MFSVRYCCYSADRTASAQLGLFARLLVTDEEQETEDTKKVRACGGSVALWVTGCSMRRYERYRRAVSQADGREMSSVRRDNGLIRWRRLGWGSSLKSGI